MKSILALLLSAIIFVSCQKELSYQADSAIANNPSGGGTNPGGGSGASSGTQLIYYSNKSTTNASDSSVISFTYDASNRLRSYSSIQNDPSQFSTLIRVGARLERDTNGRIVRIAQKTPVSSAPPPGMPNLPDTTFYSVHYPSATATLPDYKIAFIMQQGSITADSVVYTYNTNGQLITQVTYHGFDAFGSMTYIESVKVENAFNADGNLMEQKTYNLLLSPQTPTTVTTYSYSAAVSNRRNPLMIEPTIFLYLNTPITNALNDSYTLTDANGGVARFSGNYVSFNANNLPLRLNATLTSNGTTRNSIVTFMYR